MFSRSRFPALLHVPLLTNYFRYSAIDMSTFEALKLAYLRSTGKDEPGMLALLAFGSVSGSVGATSVYPMNLVRTRLQASGSSGHPERYTGVFDVATKTWAREGWRGFYRGLFPTLAKVCVFRVDGACSELTLYRSSQQCRYPTLFMNIVNEGMFSPWSCPTWRLSPFA